MKKTEVFSFSHFELITVVSSDRLINSYSLEEIKPNGIYEIEDKNMLLPKGSYILEIITPQNVYNKVLDVK